MEPLEPGEPGDIGESEELDSAAGSPIGARGRAVLAGVAIAAVAALVAVAALSGHFATATDEPESGLDPIPSPTPTASETTWPTPLQPTASPARPAAFSSSGFLADLDLDVYVRGTRAVYRIETKAGRVTRTSVPDLENSSPLWFLDGGDRVVLRPMDATTGYAVIDGVGMTPLTGLLATQGTYLPAPRGTIWVVTADADESVARRIDGAGRRTYETVRAPGDGGFTADGAGGLFYGGQAGGTYRATSAGLRRVTPGAVLATSRDRFLALECNARFVCRRVLYDRDGGAKDLGRTSGARQPYGALSADGRFAALVSWRDDTGPELEVVELASGRRLAAQQLGEDDWSGDEPVSWLPDGRLLGLRNSRLFVFDPRTRQTTSSPIRLPALRQLVVRPSGG